MVNDYLWSAARRGMSSWIYKQIPSISKRGACSFSFVAYYSSDNTARQNINQYYDLIRFYKSSMGKGLGAFFTSCTTSGPLVANNHNIILLLGLAFRTNKLFSRLFLSVGGSVERFPSGERPFPAIRLPKAESIHLHWRQLFPLCKHLHKEPNGHGRTP